MMSDTDGKPNTQLPIPNTGNPPPTRFPETHDELVEMAKKEWERRSKQKGFGDTVSKYIKKFSNGKIKECEPCKKRREKLNKMFPYKNNDKE